MLIPPPPPLPSPTPQTWALSGSFVETGELTREWSILLFTGAKRMQKLWTDACKNHEP